MKKKIFYILSFFIFFSCGRSIIGKNGEIGFYINSEANIESINAVKNSFSIWENAQNHKVKFTYKGRNKAGIIRDGKFTVSFLREFPKWVDQSYIGYCHKWFDKNGNLIESDIILNMSLTNWGTKDNPKENSYCIEGIVIHEIGHFLGFEHTENEKSIMKAVLTIEESYNLTIE
ncbi:MAG TPA: matrixin family metalloprotease [Spirochaetota bacterium]|nr:matrixin family metalloprotease [Spirochaetota bacterium]